jgi:hypothetical protein
MSCIIVLRLMYIFGAYRVSKYLPDSCVRQWLAWMLLLRHVANILLCIKIICEKPTDGLKYGECQLGNIWRYV